jgi:putative DNA primase/helicase
VKSATALADTALGKNDQHDDAADLQGQTLALQDPEPWPNDVVGAELLADLARTPDRFLALPPGAATTAALWTVHAHAHEASSISPILAITSPEKRCGKTRLLEVMGGLVPRPLPTANISPAALFRAVEKYRPTLLGDEADTFLTHHEELRGILNSGHTRAGAVVVRTVGDDHDARRFSTWAPKAIALIGKLPGTLEDRSILIPMRRRAPDERVEKLRLDRLHELEPLRRKAARWASDNLEELRQAEPEMPPELNDRAADNWRPLLAIAELAGESWPERARKAAVLLSGAVEEGEEAAGVQMLADVRDLFRERNTDRLPSSEIVEALVQLEDRPWPEWRRGQPLSKRQLASLLRRFGIKPKQLRVEGDKTRGYDLADFADAFSRYLPIDPLPESVQAVHPNNDAENSGSSIRYTDPSVPDREAAENPHGDYDVPVVPDREGGIGRATGSPGRKGETADDPDANSETMGSSRSLAKDGQGREAVTDSGCKEGVRRFPSRSRINVYHEVHRLDDGRLTCTCESFAFRSECRHVDRTCAGCMGGKQAGEAVCGTCRHLGAR